VTSVGDFQGLTFVPHELIHYHVTRVENVLPVECQDFQSSTIFPESHHSIYNQSVDDWIEEDDFFVAGVPRRENWWVPSREVDSDVKCHCGSLG